LAKKIKGTKKDNLKNTRNEKTTPINTIYTIDIDNITEAVSF